AVVDDGLSQGSVARVGIGAAAQLERVLIQKTREDSPRSGVIEILLARGGVALERLNDLDFTLVQSLLAGLLNIELDQHLVAIVNLVVGLHAGVLQSSAIKLSVNGGHIGRVRVLHVDQRATAEVYAQRDAMPERHRTHPRRAKDEREGERVPLFPEKIDVCVSRIPRCLRSLQNQS